MSLLLTIGSSGCTIDMRQAKDALLSFSKLVCKTDAEPATAVRVWNGKTEKVVPAAQVWAKLHDAAEFAAQVSSLVSFYEEMDKAAGQADYQAAVTEALAYESSVSNAVVIAANNAYYHRP